MYEKFKNEFLARISTIIDTTQLTTIQHILDDVSAGYTFEAVNTLPEVYGSGNMDLLKTFMVCKKIEGYSDGTLINYKSYMTNFFEEVRKPAEQITANDIRVYLYRYKESRHVSDRSLDKIRQYICAFFKWLHKEDYIPKDVSIQIKPIKHEVKPRVSLTQVQLEYVRRACQTTRERAMVEFLYSTGCRAAEMAVCKRSDVDFDTGTVHLFGKGKKHRLSYLNAKCTIYLKAYLDERKDDSEFLFVGRGAQPITSKTVELWIRKINERTFDQIHVNVTPHVFRHTTATTALSAGMDVQDIQKLLGHSNISTTMIYADVSQEHVHSSHSRCVV